MIDNAIALVGLACRLPGAADPAAFWRNLCAGTESITFFTDAELHAAGVDAALLADPQYVKANGCVDGVDRFDAALFGFSPTEAELLDPQQRLLLECAWEAMESAGYAPSAYPGVVGVYAGAGMNAYLLHNLYSHRELLEGGNGFQLLLANDKDFLATRIAYKLNLTGPALSVQTACSTGLVAVHLACQALLCGECDAALAGAAGIRVPQQVGYRYQEGMIFSPDGHCRAFDARAQGTIGGNGVGMVLLKRLADAVKDGDTIYAVIRATAVNNDGADKIGYTAPGGNGQEAVIREALALADADPDTIGYVEAHGTGTPLGDPIEVAALTRVYGDGGGPSSCALGSVKTNIGHLDAAAGVAGLIKAALAVYHGQIPPSLHYQQPNPQIDFARSPFFVNTTLRDWPLPGVRRAGVSSFGIGGTNAHAVLEQAPDLPSTPAGRPWQVLRVSARSPAALTAACERLDRHLTSGGRADLADVAYTLDVGRHPFLQRAVRLVGPADTDSTWLTGQAPASPPKLAFMFAGQGSQQAGMGAVLYAREPVFRAEVDRCATRLQPLLGQDIRDWLLASPDDAAATAALRQTAAAQPALFVMEYALAQLWRSWGIQPSAVLGHSLGEYVAACLAGVFSLDDALRLIAVRGQLMQTTASGAMLAVSLSDTDLADWLSAAPDLALAAVNGPRQCVVAGPADAITTLHERLSAAGHSARPLATAQAFHSRLMDPILSAFATEVRRCRLQSPRIPCLSNLTGTWLSAEQATDPDYWVQHLRHSVRFADNLSTVLADAQTLLLEIGPGQTLSSLAGARALPSLPRSQPDAQAGLLNTLGRLWLAGIGSDPAGFYADQPRRRVPLPTYPFERQRYWIEPARPAEYVLRHKLDDWFYAPGWQPAALPCATLPAASTVLLCDDDSALGQALAARLRADGHCVLRARTAAAFMQDEAGRFRLRPAEADDYRALFTALAAQGQLPTQILHLWCAAPVSGTPAERLETAQNHGFYSLLALAQAWQQIGGDRALHLGIVSSGTQDVGGTGVVCPERATLLGAATVMPQEYPHWSVRLVDLDPAAVAEPSAVLVGHLLAELAATDTVALSAYRGGRRWQSALTALPLSPPVSPPLLRQRGVYLITGGLGGIGLTLAEYLARQVQARLVLIARSPADPAILERLRAAGAEVLALSADVTQRAALTAALATAVARFGPLNGVIHAAGIAGGGVLARKTPAAAAAVLAAKVQGTLLLDELCREQPLDFLLLCSSLSSVLGGYGQIDYCAANAFLDAYASWRNAQGRRTLAIGWDSWREVGMAVTTAAPAELQALREQSLAQTGIAPDEGTAVFERALTAGVPWLLVSTQPLAPRYAARYRVIEEALQHLDHSAPASRQRHPRPLLSTSYQAPVTPLEQQLAEFWQDNLGLEQVGTADDYFELGGDSLKGLSLVNRLQGQLGEVVHVNALFEAPTVAALARYLCQHYPQAVGALGGQALQPEHSAQVDAAALERLRGLLHRLTPRAADGRRNPRAVFVLAPPRTGSTLLRVLLAGHPQLFAPPELALLGFDTLTERRAVLAGQDPSLLEGPLLALRQLLGSLDAAQAFMQDCEAASMSVRDFYAELQNRLDGRLLVDKSPDYVYDPETLDRAEREFAEPLFILLLRHPYGMIHSYEEAKLDLLLPGQARRELPWSRRQLAELLWLHSYRNLLDFEQRIPAARRRRVRFEELVQQPAQVLTDLCAFLGVPFEPAMLDPYREKQQRMTEGLHAGSRVLGDVKFHHHSGIDPAAADRWQSTYTTDFLSDLTWTLAADLGYARPAPAPTAALEALSDDAVDAALLALLARRGGAL